jgi:hypothetical protein
MNIGLSRFKTVFAIILLGFSLICILRRVNQHAKTMKDFMEEK